MIDISNWLGNFTKILNDCFSDRIYFMGLQGSYARGEATDSSDIDVVVILDNLTASDIAVYNELLDKLPYREQVCGFISGKRELFDWEPSDLFQFYYDTIPIKGSLDELLQFIDSDDVDRAIKIGACNIYHGCVHNMLHEKSSEILKGLYKSASFVLQAIAYKLTGSYCKHQNQLYDILSEKEKIIIKTNLSLKNCEDVDFSQASELLFEWAKKMISLM